MTASITQMKDALAGALESILEDAGVQEFLTFRTLKATAGVIAMLSSAGNLPTPATTGEGGIIYDFDLYVLARYENTAASQEAAENTLDDVETAVILNIIDQYSPLYTASNLWLGIEYRRASSRRNSPAEYLGWRWMEIYLRVLGN